MPIYEYRCPDGHTFEVMHSMSERPVSECEVCGKHVERVFHAPAVHFKGSGFYTTDYAKKGSKGSASEGGSAKSDSKDSKDSSKSGDSSSSDSKKSETKSETKSSSA